MRSTGPHSVCRGLSHWLNEASRLGSGDDITLAVLYRCAAIHPEQDCVVMPCAEVEIGESPAARKKNRQLTGRFKAAVPFVGRFRPAV